MSDIEKDRRAAEETLSRTNDLAALSDEEMQRYTPAAALRMIRLAAERTIEALDAMDAKNPRPE